MLKGKVKLVPVDDVKTYRGRRRLAPLILNLGTRWSEWLVNFTPRPLYNRERTPQYRLNVRLGGPQSRSGHYGEEKNLLALSGFEPWIVQPVAQSLHRLPLLRGQRELKYMLIVVTQSITLYQTDNL
jgi:hypothetical protein